MFVCVCESVIGAGVMMRYVTVGTRGQGFIRAQRSAKQRVTHTHTHTHTQTLSDPHYILLTVSMYLMLDPFNLIAHVYSENKGILFLSINVNKESPRTLAALLCCTDGIVLSQSVGRCNHSRSAMNKAQLSIIRFHLASFSFKLLRTTKGSENLT